MGSFSNTGAKTYRPKLCETVTCKNVVGDTIFLGETSKNKCLNILSIANFVQQEKQNIIDVIIATCHLILCALEVHIFYPEIFSPNPLKFHIQSLVNRKNQEIEE